MPERLDLAHKVLAVPGHADLQYTALHRYWSRQPMLVDKGPRPLCDFAKYAAEQLKG